METNNMSMVAAEDVLIGQDITPSIPPLSHALFDSHLLSHCSSCFSPLNNNTFPPNIPSTSTVLYCSRQCYLSDSPLHFSSAEFHFLRHRHHLSSTDSADIRLALRLLHALSPSRATQRINGLLTNRERLLSSDDDDGGAVKIKEGARAMKAALRLRDGVEEFDDDLLEAVVCLVVTNSVEVLGDRNLSVGVAVYDVRFSWINHSCSPNAVYRFSSCSGFSEVCEAESSLQIVPAGFDQIMENDTCSSRHWELCEGESTSWILPAGFDQMMEKDASSTGGLVKGCKRYGPWIIVRSIKMIKKGEEIYVTYTDLLQPKEARQSHLWSKFRFLCCCMRCSTSNYIDHALQEIYVTSVDSSSLSPSINSYKEAATEMLSNNLDNAIAEYMSVGDAEICCKNLEYMLIHALCDEQLETKKGFSKLTFRLQPLHHLSLNAYTALASAYKVRASDLLVLHSENDSNQLEAFHMRRISTAYSLVLAGATHHLFRSESSIIVSVANFWTNAGESLLNLARSSIWSVFARGMPVPDLPSISKFNCSKCSLMERFEAISSCRLVEKRDFDYISGEFLHCVGNITQKFWSFLIHGCHYFRLCKDPIDYSWIETMHTSTIWNLKSHTDVIDGNPSYDSVDGISSWESRRFNMYQLGVHCLLYGGYLATIGYGKKSPMLYHIQNILYNDEILVGGSSE